MEVKTQSINVRASNQMIINIKVFYDNKHDGKKESEFMNL